MFSVPYSVGLLLALATGSPAQEPANSDAPFPASNALAEGVSPDVLVALGDLVQGFVDDKEIVGAELLVIKNGHSILHEAYGWRDREAQVAMETGSVFCVRSMTKPLIGASILMLVDDREIKLDDHVAEYLPSFDVEGSRDITIEHLLTHTSGLPMSLLLGKNLRE
ncbi:MAG TPA: serine hydrolase domain-containing protein, partial [Planctomycetota bacterium]|nr:serine hydrolase domain-containing protein [Planctomycetota bacterium]